jgi:putative transposase
LQVINLEEYRSLPSSQIVPDLADKGIYIASESSFYRVLKQYNRQHHRGKSQKPSDRKLSIHCATEANQVWMWDITWLPELIKGIYFYLYLILDLYSRKIHGWEIWTEEKAEHAAMLVRKAVLKEKIGVRTFSW